MKHSLLIFSATAVLLVLLRSWIPLTLEGYFFDSDQAIVGLMALHLRQLRHFPLYYYGLNYLLGVQAWIIAAAFTVMHPSVTAMRVPLVVLNATVAVWLIAAIRRDARLRPALAFAAALPFVMPTPATAAYLVEAAGASIEPFVYILLLWTARRRAFLFGLILAFGTLHREFTLYAVPAIAAATLAGAGWRPIVRPSTARAAGWALSGAALVWLVADDLKLRLGGGSVALQAASLGGQLCGEPQGLAARGHALVTQAVPALFGGLRIPLLSVRLDTPIDAGSGVVGTLVYALLAAMAARALWLMATRGTPAPAAEERDADFGVYLAAVGACAALAYPLSCSVLPEAPPLMRYLPLVLMLPVGIAVMFFSREPMPRLRAVAAAAFVAWAAFNLVDNARVIRSAAVAPPLNERRTLTDYLTANGIRFARANYWDAYVIDFLSGERVMTGSVDLVRIPEYQEQIKEHAAETVDLDRLPCSGGVRIASWCVIAPQHGSLPTPR